MPHVAELMAQHADEDGLVAIDHFHQLVGHHDRAARQRRRRSARSRLLRKSERCAGTLPAGRPATARAKALRMRCCCASGSSLGAHQALVDRLHRRLAHRLVDARRQQRDRGPSRPGHAPHVGARDQQHDQPDAHQRPAPALLRAHDQRLARALSLPPGVPRGAVAAMQRRAVRQVRDARAVARALGPPHLAQRDAAGDGGPFDVQAARPTRAGAPAGRARCGRRSSRRRSAARRARPRGQSPMSSPNRSPAASPAASPSVPRAWSTRSSGSTAS